MAKSSVFKGKDAETRITLKPETAKKLLDLQNEYGYNSLSKAVNHLINLAHEITIVNKSDLVLNSEMVSMIKSLQMNQQDQNKIYEEIDKLKHLNTITAATTMINFVAMNKGVPRYIQNWSAEKIIEEIPPIIDDVRDIIKKKIS